MKANHEDIYARTTRNRYEVATFLEGLTPQQWEARTLCHGWQVRHVATHFAGRLVSFPRFAITSLRFGGDTDATVDHVTHRLARQSPEELVARIRRHATERVSPPRVGPMGPFAETCIHLRDIARPLALTWDARHEDWMTLLTYLTTPGAAPALVSSARITGVQWIATDAHWSHGEGPEIAGPVEALTMAIAGRYAALADCAGPGVEALQKRTT